MIITLPSGQQYGPNKQAALNSLFNPVNGKTLDGHYTKKAGGVLFYDMQGKPFLFLVCNRYGERFFVTCYYSEPEKSIRYMHGLATVHEKALGFDGMTNAQQSVFAYAVAEKVGF